MNVLVSSGLNSVLAQTAKRLTSHACEKPNICMEGNGRLVHTGKQTVQKRRKSFDDYFIFVDAAYFDMTLLFFLEARITSLKYSLAR